MDLIISQKALDRWVWSYFFVGAFQVCEQNPGKNPQRWIGVWSPGWQPHWALKNTSGVPNNFQPQSHLNSSSRPNLNLYIRKPEFGTIRYRFGATIHLKSDYLNQGVFAKQWFKQCQKNDPSAWGNYLQRRINFLSQSIYSNGVYQDIPCQKHAKQLIKVFQN